MKILKIEDIFDVIRNGATIQQSPQAKGIPITRIETTSNDRFNRDKLGYANIFDSNDYQKYILQDNDLLMSHINSEKYLGRTVLYKKIPDETIIHGMNLLLLRANPNIANPCYMNYYFKSDEFKQKVAKMTKKSVNQASFNINSLKSIELKLPILEEQVEIYKKLDKICLMIDKKQQQLNKYDELVKSQFIEMFGDKFDKEQIKISEIANAIIGLTYKPENVSNNGTIILRSGNIQNNELQIQTDIVRVDNIKIPENKYLKENDILMCSRNGSAKLVGKSCLINNLKEQMSFGAFMTVIRTEYPYFLQSFFCSEYFKKQLTGVSTTSVNQITTGMLNNYLVIKPTKDEENKFADFVKHIDKLKFTIKQSIEKLELCYKSLMKEYFD